MIALRRRAPEPIPEMTAAEIFSRLRIAGERPLPEWRRRAASAVVQRGRVAVWVTTSTEAAL